MPLMPAPISAWRVRHRAHDPRIPSQPALEIDDARAGGDRHRHRDCRNEGRERGRRLAHLLRLHRHHDELGPVDRTGCGFAEKPDAGEAFGELVLLLGKRLDDAKRPCVGTLVDHAANECGGHVAATDEGDVHGVPIVNREECAVRGVRTPQASRHAGDFAGFKRALRKSQCRPAPASSLPRSPTRDRRTCPSTACRPQAPHRASRRSTRAARRIRAAAAARPP